MDEINHLLTDQPLVTLVLGAILGAVVSIIITGLPKYINLYWIKGRNRFVTLYATYLLIRLKITIRYNKDFRDLFIMLQILLFACLTALIGLIMSLALYFIPIANDFIFYKLVSFLGTGFFGSILLFFLIIAGSILTSVANYEEHCLNTIKKLKAIQEKHKSIALEEKLNSILEKI